MAAAETIDHLFVVPSSSVHRIQEAQTTTYHVLWELTQSAVSGTRDPGPGQGPRDRCRGSATGRSCTRWPPSWGWPASSATTRTASSPRRRVRPARSGPSSPGCATGRRCWRWSRTSRSAPLRPIGGTGFAIVPSGSDGRRRSPVSADAATCADCLAELWDPADRRYRYPFVNCTNCGPRFTVVTGIPYDRPLTTMAGFPMCADCAREYADPGDRRFHAQPVCCPACGPALSLVDAAGAPVAGDPVSVAAEVIRAGAVLAVKGLGGYHLAVRRVLGAGGRAAPGAQAPRGAAVRGAGRRPRRRRDAGLASTPSRPTCSPAGAGPSCCSRAGRVTGSPRRSPRATGRSA